MEETADRKYRAGDLLGGKDCCVRTDDPVVMGGSGGRDHSGFRGGGIPAGAASDADRSDGGAAVRISQPLALPSQNVESWNQCEMRISGYQRQIVLPG